MTKTSKCSKLLPYHIIAAAASGDVEAINVVLKHYEGYIAALATRKLYDEKSTLISQRDNGNNTRCLTLIIPSTKLKVKVSVPKLNLPSKRTLPLGE